MKTTCPTCRTPEAGVLLGTLGHLEWFRCRFCGWDYSRVPTSRKHRRALKLSPRPVRQGVTL